MLLLSHPFSRPARGHTFQRYRRLRTRPPRCRSVTLCFCLSSSCRRPLSGRHLAACAPLLTAATRCAAVARATDPLGRRAPGTPRRDAGLPAAAPAGPRSSGGVGRSGPASSGRDREAKPGHSAGRCPMPPDTRDRAGRSARSTKRFRCYKLEVICLGSLVIESMIPLFL